MQQPPRGFVGIESFMRKDMGASESGSEPVGRRGAKATALILHAALELGDELGFEALTVEKIADRSGIAKTTIYRRWPNVSAIVMDAFLSQVMKDAPIVEKATVRETFAAAMKLLIHAYRGRNGLTLRTLIGRAQTDENLRHAVETRWVEPRRQSARDILKRGMRRGELSPDLDPDIILDALYGAIYHRLLVPYKKSVLSADFIDALIAIIFNGIESRNEESV
jgi:AcrR family transcriptional regulator